MDSKSQIKLSNVVTEGLQCLNTTINSDLTKKLISNAVKMALYSDANIPGNPEIYATKPDYTKQAEYAVLTAISIAIKNNLETKMFRTMLEQHNLSSLALEELVQVYDTNKVALRLKHLTTGHSLPHLTNVEWKLTCDIKSSQIESYAGSEILNYNINLGRFMEKTGERETIAEFVCNVEELQAFVNKLKAIERHCEQLADGK